MLDLLPTGFLFGIIDNGIVVATMLGVTFFATRCLTPDQRRLAWRVSIAATLTASLGNTASDFAGCVGDPTMWADVYGITGGCLSWTVALLIPQQAIARVRAS